MMNNLDRECTGEASGYEVTTRREVVQAPLNDLSEVEASMPEYLNECQDSISPRPQVSTNWQHLQPTHVNLAPLYSSPRSIRPNPVCGRVCSRPGTSVQGEERSENIPDRQPCQRMASSHQVGSGLHACNQIVPINPTVNFHRHATASVCSHSYRAGMRTHPAQNHPHMAYCHLINTFCPVTDGIYPYPAEPPPPYRPYQLPPYIENDPVPEYTSRSATPINVMDRVRLVNMCNSQHNENLENLQNHERQQELECVLHRESRVNVLAL